MAVLSLVLISLDTSKSGSPRITSVHWGIATLLLAGKFPTVSSMLSIN